MILDDDIDYEEDGRVKNDDMKKIGRLLYLVNQHYGWELVLIWNLKNCCTKIFFMKLSVSGLFYEQGSPLLTIKTTHYQKIRKIKLENDDDCFSLHLGHFKS